MMPACLGLFKFFKSVFYQCAANGAICPQYVERGNAYL
jgi:hypothetical protein